jgi:DNA polymerase-3 subunit epsilon
MRSLAEVVARRDFLVLDTETTGLDNGAEIVQIAIIDAAGETLLDTLVKPVGNIPPAASNVHGITAGQVAAAPIWPELAPAIRRLLRGRDVIIYNAEYDVRMLNQSTTRWNGVFDWNTLCTYHCAMLAFSERRGVWSDYHSNYRWWKLTDAAAHMGIPVHLAHTALGDALMTLLLVQAMYPEGVTA